MPNIEIHGFNQSAAELWRKAIFSVAKGKPFISDMVVTIVLSNVKNHKEEDVPFLRIVSTLLKDKLGDPRDPRRVISLVYQMLLPFGIDIEILILDEFVQGTNNFTKDSPPPKLTK